MDRQSIYLENDDEITSVVDKLKSADSVGLDLVIPKESILLQSVVNLKLLKRQAETLGKEITIVTQDKVGTKLAEQVGIPVVAKEGDVPVEVSISEAEPTPELSEEDLEIKEPKPELEPEKSSEPIDKPTKPASAEATAGRDAKTKDVMPKFPWKKFGIIGGIVGLILLVVAYIYVPLTTVTVKMAAEKKKVDVSFTVDKDNSGVDTGNQTIPGRLIDENKEKSQKFPTTGKKKTGTKATGTVTVSNKYSTTPQTVIAGSRVVSSANLVFKTTSNVTVPGYTKPAADIIAGTASVGVEADDFGDNYNVGPSHFTIPAADPNIYADSAAAFAGGTSRDITFVTQTDINKAKEEAGKGIEEDLKKEISDKVDEGEKLLDESVKITQVSATPSVGVNGEASEFEMRIKSNGKALVFKEDDLKKLAESVLGEEIGNTKEIVEKESLTSSTEFVSADYDKGEMKARLAGEAFIATKLEQDKIKAELSGDAEARAREYLKGLDGVDDVEFKFFPSFYHRVPRVKNHIYIKTTVSKVQE